MISRRLASRRLAVRAPLVLDVDADAPPPTLDVSRYYDDPIGYAIEVLGVTPWDDGTDDCQAGLLRAVAAHDRVTCRSGHKTGKTGDYGILALWWYHTRLAESPRVIISAPTDRQVNEAGFREVKIRFRGSLHPIPGRLNESARAGLRGPYASQIFGFATPDPDRLSGPSAGKFLVLYDEAAGMESDVYEALEGMLAGGGKLVMVGNPTSSSGPFHDSHHKEGTWKRIHLDSEKVVEWQARHGKISGLATREAIERMRAMWGPNDPRYLARVRGIFPRQGASDVFDSLEVLDAFVRHRNYVYDPQIRRVHRVEIGLDVARFGDDESVAYARHGWYVYPCRTWKNLDSKALAREVVAYAIEVQRGKPSAKRDPWLPKPLIRIDSIGVGAGVFDELASTYREAVDVVPVCASESAVERDEYANTRAELAFVCRKALPTLALPEDAMLDEELRAVAYKFSRDQRIQIRSKDEIKEKIGRSPDRADALFLCVYDTGETGKIAPFKISTL